MKLILCTLAVCLSILASVFTTRDLIRSEGKKVRSSLPKSLTEPPDAPGNSGSLAQKLDTLNAQLGTLNRRLNALEETSVRPSQALPQQVSTGGSQTLSQNAAGLTATLVRLDALSQHLTALTTYLDKSFEHLEQTVAKTAAAPNVSDSVEGLSKKIDAIDSYFTPLYAFLGLVYDPANNDLLATYPSVDTRINALFMQIEALQKDVSYVRLRVTPMVYEPPTHHTK